MSLHARSTTSDSLSVCMESADVSGAAYDGNRGSMWRGTKGLLLFSFLFKRLVTISMKLQLCGDAANTVFQSPTWANSNVPPICSFFFSWHPIHKAITDTVTSHAPCKQAWAPSESHLTLKPALPLSHIGTQSVHVSPKCSDRRFLSNFLTLNYFRVRQQFSSSLSGISHISKDTWETF